MNPNLRVWAVLADGPEGLTADSPIVKGGVPFRQKPDITVVDIKTNKVVEHRLLTPQWKPEDWVIHEDD
jgi:hypothetical protein